ncbi:Tetrahydromethanopterin-linked C1 transfer pathway [Planctomycetales bacterium 10988]|nr:Tetrahydromethanopterin-linked C1 transfer pathway [Planctomycetales bacterium 10988]
MKPVTDWIGLDIGGANIKLAHESGLAFCDPFCLWKAPQQLAARIKHLLQRASDTLWDEESLCPNFGVVATMTGELADCYPTKKYGVRHILNSTSEAVRVSLGTEVPLLIYSTSGFLPHVRAALESWEAVAAANWHGLAQFVASWQLNRTGLLFDLGSTTTDLIPYSQGKVLANGSTDCERLHWGELIYVGTLRTPLCSLIQELPFRGQHYPVAKEFFATMKDIFLLSGMIAEDEEDFDTADGRASTKELARGRLARMLCLDSESYTMEDAQLATEYVVNCYQEVLGKSLVRHLSQRKESEWDQIVVSGSGEHLARSIAQKVAPGIEIVSLRDSWGVEASTAAPAFALAKLASQLYPREGSPS